jgi:hypothetical protein
MTTAEQLRDHHDRLLDLGDDAAADGVAVLAIELEAGVVSEVEAGVLLASLLGA